MKSLLVISLLLFYRVTISGIKTKAERQGQTLLKWKGSLGEAASGSLVNSWSWSNSTSSSSPCDWSGVTCDPATGSITQLELQNTSINGTLHGLNFSNLPALLRLDLSNNLLHGPIPSSISALSCLKFLDFGNNQFDGRIPPELGSLSELIVLKLNNNSLVSPIPFQLSQLQKDKIH